MPYFKFTLTDTKTNPFHRLTRMKQIFIFHSSLFMYSFGSCCYGNNTENATFNLKSTWQKINK